MRYDYKIPEQSALYRELRAAVESCVKEGMTSQETRDALTGMGTKMWGDEETGSLISGLHWTAEQPIKAAAYAAKKAAEKAAEPPPSPDPKPKKRVLSITKQGRAARKAKYVPAVLERRDLGAKWPGCRIDKNFHVFRSDGSEAAYSLDKRFVTCARLKNEDGEWKYPAVFRLMELAGFRKEYVRAPKPKTGWAAHYNSLDEAQAEDPEMYGDPNGLVQ
jgi:hypothetical protein